MEYIYTTSSPGTAFNYNKCMLGIFNGVGSGGIVRIYRIWQMNAQTVAVTGLNVIMAVCRITTGSGGFATQIAKHDSTNPNIPPQIVCATNMDYAFDANGYEFMRYLWSSDEPSAIAANTIDEVQVQPNFCLVLDYDRSYVSSDVAPITLREGYGIAVIHVGSYSVATETVPVGSADFFIEFSFEPNV